MFLQTVQKGKKLAQKISKILDIYFIYVSSHHSSMSLSITFHFSFMMGI